MNFENITTIEYKYNEWGKSAINIVYSDGTQKSVPMNTSNTDYQEILEWVAAGNTITDPGAQPCYLVLTLSHRHRFPHKRI